MSTNWYAAHKGIARIVLSEHSARHGWFDALDQDGDVVGMVREDYAGLLADRSRPAARVAGGGLTVYSTDGDDSPVISENGDVSTLGILRRKHREPWAKVTPHCPRCERPVSRCGCGS